MFICRKMHGLALASHGWTSGSVLGFSLGRVCGALLLRGAGCTINDLLDRDIDIKVINTLSSFAYHVVLVNS
ncbi:hypothetical protein ACS0TY_006550 [Phlomoides rotata]